MAIQLVPYVLQNAAHSAALFRQASTERYVSGGRIQLDELIVAPTYPTNTMAVQVGPGRAIVPGTFVTNPSTTERDGTPITTYTLPFNTQGMYHVLNDAATVLTVANADVTNPRIDLVYIQVQDSQYSGTADQVILDILSGVPASTPVAPSVPANSIALAYITVPVGATEVTFAGSPAQANIVQDRTAHGSVPAVLQASTLDSVIDFASTAELGADPKYFNVNFPPAISWTQSERIFAINDGGSWSQLNTSYVGDETARDAAYSLAPSLLNDGVEALVNSGFGPTVKQQYNVLTDKWETTSRGLIPPYLGSTAVQSYPTSGSASGDPTGHVTIGSSTVAVLINNILDQDSETTVIEFDITPSVSDSFTLNLTSGGTSISTNYYTQWTQSNNTTVNAGRYSATSAWQIQPISNSAGQAGRITIKKMNNGQWRFFSDQISIGGTSPITVSTTGYHGAVTADGIYLASAGGHTFSGNVRIYTIK
jgi:hypothetical protein